MEQYQKGTFGYDVATLNQRFTPIILGNTNGNSILLCPELQGRVMTSTVNGMDGYSIGWVNHDLLSTTTFLPQVNSFGGEERFWLGPEGGQFSIFFKNKKGFDFKDWQTPAALDTEPFQLLEQGEKRALFSRDMQLENYSGTQFSLNVNREVILHNHKDLSQKTGLNLDEIDVVGYTTVNTVKNTGQEAWNPTTGALSVWLLGMYKPSDRTTIFVPCKPEETKNAAFLTSNYFGEVGSDRLKTINNIVYFKGDGKRRSKIGVTPQAAKSVCGSYDAENNILTLLFFDVDPKSGYVNSLWELQDKPFAGDAINSYNDGPLEDGSQLGPFYEIESSSRALFLAPGEKEAYEQTTVHITGNKVKLDEIVQTVLGISIDEIKTVF